MEKVTDWIKLWKELVERQGPFWNLSKRSDENAYKWKDRAKKFDARVKKRWSKPDPHRAYIISMISQVKEASVLDIGAGTGAWSILMSKAARKITAIEPSPDMRSLFRDHLKKEGINNVEILDGSWPIKDIESHDFTLSSHSVYGCEDLSGFINAMTNATRYTCFMLLRAPEPGGLMARAAERIWGQPYNSPNFQLVYNAMLQMGMFPNVLMEEKGLWPGKTSKNFDEAYEKIRRRFGVDEGSEHGAYLRNLLKENLKEVEGKVQWPAEVRTGLLYWNTYRSTTQADQVPVDSRAPSA
ncbi:class I SAM-dependent methyltransferase [Thermodesulfobacteriota bacterium]